MVRTVLVMACMATLLGGCSGAGPAEAGAPGEVDVAQGLETNDADLLGNTGTLGEVVFGGGARTPDAPPPPSPPSP